MPNTHAFPDTGQEIQGICGDLLAPVILATTLAVPVPASMTLPAFSTYAYVRVGTPTRLKYVNQEPEPVTLAGGDGAYWLAITHNVATPPAGWLRAEGTHYLWRAAGTQPADPPGGLVLAQVTVASGGITAVNTSYNYPHTKVAFGGVAGELAFDTNLTWSESVLTVRNTVDARHVRVLDHAGDNLIAFFSTAQAAGGTNRWFLYESGDAPSYLGGTLMVQGTVQANATLIVAGSATIGNNLAVGGGQVPIAGVALVTGAPSHLSASVGIGMIGTPPTQALDVNGVVRARAGVIADTNITTATLNASGLVSALSLNATNIWGTYLGAGGGIDTRFTLRSYGNTYFDGVVNMGSEAGYKLNVGGHAYIAGVLGVGTAPNGAYSIITGGALYIAGAAHFNSSLYVAGQLTGAANFNTNAVTCTTLQATSNIISNACQISYGGFGYAGLGGYSLRAGASWCDSLFVAGGSDGVHTFRCYGHSYMDGNLRVAINLAVGAVEPGYEGYGFHVQPNAKFRAALHCDGPATKPGGGPWADSSSRTLKRNIQPIAEALGLLLAQQGRAFEWEDPMRAGVLPGVRYGLIAEEVTLAQWHDGDGHIAAQGFEALVIEALREIVTRLAALERH